MKIPSPSPVLLLAAVCGVAAAAAVLYYRGAFAKLDVGDRAETAFAHGGQESASLDELTARQQRLISRINAKVEVGRALALGKIALDQAATQLRELSADDPDALRFLRPQFPMATDDELWYRQAVGYVAGFARMYPEQVEAILPKLQAEVARRFPTRGAPTVPPQPESGRALKTIPHAIEIVGDPAGHVGTRIKTRRR